MFGAAGAPAVPRDLDLHVPDGGHRARAGQWYANVFNEVMASTAQAGILVLVWVNGIMYLMRQFVGGVSHRVSPVALIAVTAIPAAAGLYLFSHAAHADHRVRGGRAPRRRHRVLVADDARHHVGAVPARRRAGAGDHRRHRQLRHGDRRPGDGLPERPLRPARDARHLGDPARRHRGDLRGHLPARQGGRRVQGGDGCRHGQGSEGAMARVGDSGARRGGRRRACRDLAGSYRHRSD